MSTNITVVARDTHTLSLPAGTSLDGVVKVVVSKAGKSTHSFSLPCYSFKDKSGATFLAPRGTFGGTNALQLGEKYEVELVAE